MARPQKSGEEKRSYMIRVRVTSTEKKQLKKAAQDAGYTISDFMRLKSIDSSPRIKKATPERAAFIQGLAELGKIGSNINQIARALNRRQHDNNLPSVPDEVVLLSLQRVDNLSNQLLLLLDGH